MLTVNHSQSGSRDLEKTFSVKFINRLGNISYRFLPKRIFDLALSLAIAPAVLPILAVLWLIARRDGGPGFFVQPRIGQNGKTFNCYKIRSMRMDADAYLERYLSENEDARREYDIYCKLRHDPRITPLGHFIRKTSLDELPQIINVIRGDMSLVGPRPFMVGETQRYGPARRYYYTLKPGITGIWQTSGRNDVTFDERVQMDLKYFKNISFKTDLELIYKTAIAVIEKEGR